MMRLFYHTESDSLFLSEPGEWQNSADGALSEDVSDVDRFRSLAVLEGIDLSQITEEPEHKSTGGIAGAIAASMAKWIRKPADLYPTPPDVTFSLLPHIEHLLPVGSRICEPACAEGKMVKPLEQFGYQVDGYDLRPDVVGGMGGVDFLDPDSNVYCGPFWHGIITNPPFRAADAFIRRAREIAPVVCMLLKAQYWNTDNRKSLFRETKPYMELNLTWRPAFLEEERGKSPLMDCMWMVWLDGYDGECITKPIDRLMACPMSEASFGGL